MPITLAALKALVEGDIENAMTASIPGGIEAQEAAGQKALVASTDMPKHMRPSREAYEKLGFEFGDDVDDIFVSAKLPVGWTREATEHSMHSYILDEFGRRRVDVFYKAAFYDRRADAGLNVRYTCGTDYSRCEGDEYFVSAMDQGTPFHEFGTVQKDDFEALNKLEADARAWMSENYPDFRDPLAYWDDDE